MAALRIPSSGHIFDDSIYHSVRRDLTKLLDVLAPIAEDNCIAPSTFEDWRCLCDLFQTCMPHITPIHERIIAWNPEHLETQKVKSLWIQMFTVLQNPELDQREHAIANLLIFLEYTIGHSEAEKCLLSLEEGDSKQTDSEPSAMSASSGGSSLSPDPEDEILEPAASAVIFNDDAYASIRVRFHQLMGQLRDALKTPLILENWGQLCLLYQKNLSNLELFHEQITAWNPEHEETQKVKNLWTQMLTALQNPEVDLREHVIATFFILAEYVMEHDAAEKKPRLLFPEDFQEDRGSLSPTSPTPAGLNPPPSSPVGFADTEPHNDKTD